MTPGKERNIIITITVLIDIILLSILFTQQLLPFDTIFCIVNLIFHALLYYSLSNDNKKIINFLHYMLFISITLGIFIDNRYILALVISLLIIIQILWIIYNECILNRISHIEHGYGKAINILTLLLTVIISTKLGYKLTI